MKFVKFVKSLGTEGVIYKRNNGERWLASHSVFMRIPEDVRSLTGREMFDMPEGMEIIINCAALGIPCELHKALMPVPNGAIKDCVRVFATENALYQIPISNKDYGLIEKMDVLEVYSKYNTELGTDEAKALVVKDYPPVASDEPELVGFILPVDLDKE